jgi:hypothetical protein
MNFFKHQPKALEAGKIENWISRGRILEAKYLILFLDGDYYPQFARTEKAKNAIVSTRSYGRVEKIIELK